MQRTDYFSGCYSHRDLNWISNGGSWPVYNNDISPNMSGQSCNNFYPPPNVDQNSTKFDKLNLSFRSSVSGCGCIIAKMQRTDYFSGCYSHRDLNWISNGGSWPVYNNDISPNMSGQSCNNFYPPPNVDQNRVDYYQKIGQTMLRHEKVFKEQVQELHRLHKRQRDLMYEFKRRGLKEPDIVPVSHYNIILSKVSSGCASIMLQTPSSSILPWINPDANKLSTPDPNSRLPSFNILSKIENDAGNNVELQPKPPVLPWIIPDANKLSSLGPKSLLPSFNILSKNKHDSRNNVELQPKYKKHKRKMLDLELPPDEYVDSEEEGGNEVQTNSSHQTCERNVIMMALDLNMPPTLLLEEETFQTNIQTEDGAKLCCDNNSDKESIVYHNEASCETNSKLVLFDLNICVDEEEDECLPSLPILKPSENTLETPEIDLEGPVSPENKESTPPRGDSLENTLESPVQMSKQQEDSDSDTNHVSSAAKTIFLISSSSFNEKTQASFVESLNWFANVVVSFVENTPKDVCFTYDGSEKEETECVVALPSQEGKLHRKRRMNRKVLAAEISRCLSSCMSYESCFNENLQSWGKGNKRRRGMRVPASCIRPLWS